MVVSAFGGVVTKLNAIIGLGTILLAGRLRNMTEALERIGDYFEEFRQSVEACRSAETLRPVDWRAAHSALGRLRERFLHEKTNLTPAQQAALQKVFEDDVFIKGMMEFRQVGEHVVRRPNGPQIWTAGNVPVQLTVEFSAMAVFAGPIVTLLDVKDTPHRIDHLERLTKAEGRISAALTRARQST